MKLLVFKDKQCNGDEYSLLIPEGMDRWKMSSFRDFMRVGHENSQHAGYLPRPVNVLRQESLRQLVNFPESTYNRTVTFEQSGRRLTNDDAIELSGNVNSVLMGRETDGRGPDSRRISVVRRNKRAFRSCKAEVVRAVDGMFDYDAHQIMKRDGSRVTSLEHVVEGFCHELDAPNQLCFLHCIAQLVHGAPFENISKIIDGVQLRSGYEMWSNMAADFGGVCAEKTAAFKFICDILSVPTHAVIGSRSPIPKDFEPQLGAYIDSHGEGESPIHVCHYLIEVVIDSKRYLVDVTNGNVPFMFLDEADSAKLLQAGFRSRMVYRVERLHMARVSNWVGDALLTLSEYHVPDLHLQYIFEQGLGLHISRNAYVGVYFDWGGERSALMQNHYSRLASRVRFVFPRFIHTQNMHSIPDDSLMHLLETTLGALRERYGDRRYTGDFAFVIQPLTSHFWQMPRVSDSVRRILCHDH